VTETLALSPELRAAFSSVRSLVVLTGAGMSAESGVPTFRGPGGLWEGHRPEDLATPEAFERDPERVWRWYRWRLEKMSEAEPHEGHRVLARLEDAPRPERFAIVTQNVDGMHQRAGNQNVVELHGNITRARCSAECGRTMDAAAVDPARCWCPCGSGRWRPDVVWFGESLPSSALFEASGLLQGADMVWVVGTSSVVYPAAAMPAMAAERGIPVLEINPESTPLAGPMVTSFRVTAAGGLPVLEAAFGA
jgi:NAD-dependent deacetylase